MTAYGYARVSTDKQDTDAQRHALAAAGCTEIVEEQASGRKARPALGGLLARLGPGDSVAVYKIDRLTRSAQDFHNIAARITAAGAELRSLTEPIDTGSAVGRAMLALLAIFAELEADHASERIRSGLKAAKARGRALGRPRAVSAELETEIRAKLDEGAAVEELARNYRIGPATVRRIRARKLQS